jgi:uncharacterized protein (TIGR03118 family)
MLIRRLIAAGAAIGLVVSAAIPVAAHGPHPAANAYDVTVLVSGPSPDADLVNAWGLSRGPASPWWIADNGTDLTTVYNADGTKRVLPRVSLPDGAPTGTVFNGVGADFNGDLFLFSGESGNIFGWRGALGTTAEVGNGDFAGDAVYKGLAIGMADVGNGLQQYLYATDFHNGRVDVFDGTFAAQSWTDAFVDPRLPKGYSPFGIQELNGMLFVTFAKTQPGSDDERAGQGRGIVDAFANDGSFAGRVATHGLLNAPWGLAWAPAGFGRFSGDLLVGNFGDGKVLAYRWNGRGWHPDGQLRGTNGQPIRIDGLWAIAFGSGGAEPALTNNGPATTLFYTAGPNDEDGGAFGTVTTAP